MRGDSEHQSKEAQQDILKLVRDRDNRAADYAVGATHDKVYQEEVIDRTAHYNAVEEVSRAEPNEKKNDTGTPSELLVPKHQDGESASEAAKLKPPQAVEQEPLDRLVKFQGNLSGNNKDGGNTEDDARLPELNWHLPRLLLHMEEPRSHSRKYSQVIQRYHKQYQAGYDAAAQAQMIAEDQTTAAANHRERSKYLSTAHKERVRTCSDQPGLLGPKALHALKGQGHSRDESDRRPRYNKNPPLRQGKVKSQEDLEDRHLHEQLFHMEEQRSIIRRGSQVIQRHYEQYQTGDDDAGRAQMIQTTTVTPEEDNDQLSSISTKTFGDNFQRCYECPAQNRCIIAYPLIGGHFSDTTNYPCFATSYCTRGKFGDNFQRCYECPAQNRGIIVFLLSCGHSSVTTDDPCLAISYSTRGLDTLKLQYENATATDSQFLTAFLKNGGSKEEEEEYRPPGQVGHKYPAQNRFTVTYPHTGGHFCFASNYCATIGVWEAGDTAGKGPGKGGSCQGKGTS